MGMVLFFLLSVSYNQYKASKYSGNKYSVLPSKNVKLDRPLKKAEVVPRQNISSATVEVQLVLLAHQEIPTRDQQLCLQSDIIKHISSKIVWYTCIISNTAQREQFYDSAYKFI
jgi:hypothetical protein